MYFCKQITNCNIMKRVISLLLPAVMAICLLSCTESKLEVGAEVRDLVASGVIVQEQAEGYYGIKNSYFMDIPFDKHFIEEENGKVKYIRYTNYSEMYQEVYSTYKETLKKTFSEKYGDPFSENDNTIVWVDDEGIAYSIIEFINEVNPYVTTHLLNVTICKKSDLEI